jgi:hypothetical protein
MARAIGRASVVLGAAVGDKLRRQAGRILDQIGGRADCLMAAVVDLEVNSDEVPKAAIGLLISMARNYARDGVPDWVEGQLKRPPRPIGSGPLPSETRPMHYWSAADMPKSEGSTEGVAAKAREFMRAARRAVLAGGRRGA